jgi:Leucine-rich repeat (LRR) protein
VSAALAQLSNLQQLHLDDSTAVSYSCLAGLSQLTQLTLLELGYVNAQQLQPLLAQPLPLRVLRLGGLSGLDLSHLTQLLQLYICTSTDGKLSGTVFPPQLQQLKVGSEI